jgi:hypothetical protein
MNEFQEKLSQALASLGETPDQVAETLKQAGVRGRRRDYQCCPVASYLSKVACKNITVGLHKAGYDPMAADGQVDVPSPVQTFILRFDLQEAYPSLLEGNP